MATLLDKLHNDHINFMRLLQFLTAQSQLLEECANEDLTLMYDAIRYMKEYPDLIHHPLENIIFAYFLRHYQDCKENINDLLHEHDQLPALTDKLLETLESALAGIPQKRSNLCASLKEYVTIQKEHMDQEEAKVYPALRSRLDDNDWVQIKTELAKVEDPLFGKQAEASYQNLLNHITASA